MKIDTRTNIEPQVGPEPQIERRPWWVYFLYAGTDIIGRVLSTGILFNSKNGRKPTRGVDVSRKGLKPSIDPRMITATTVIGERVIGSDGKELGKIEEVALDLTAGVISYFVLSTGGILGFGDKFYAISLDSLTLEPAEKVFYMDIDKKMLKKMPEINKHNWPTKVELTK